MVNFDKVMKNQLDIASIEKRKQQYTMAMYEEREFDTLNTYYKIYYLEFIMKFYPKWLEDMIKDCRDEILDSGIDNFKFVAEFRESGCENPLKAGCVYLSNFSPKTVLIKGYNTEFGNMLENFFVRNSLLEEKKEFGLTKGMYIVGTFKQLKDAYYNEMQAFPMYEEFERTLDMYDGSNSISSSEKNVRAK